MSANQEEDFLAPLPWAAHFLEMIYPALHLKLTPEQQRRLREYRRQRDALKDAGLLDDWELEIGPTDCPHYVEITDDTSKRCELPRGHEGLHRVTFEQST